MPIPQETTRVEIKYQDYIVPISTDFEKMELGPAAVRGTVSFKGLGFLSSGEIEDENGVSMTYLGNRFSKKKLAELEVGDYVLMGGLYRGKFGFLKTHAMDVYNCDILEKECK